MSNFTITLGDLVEANGGHTEVVDGRTILFDAHIGLDWYPEWTPGYRAILNGLIFDEYMNEEIAHETDSLFVQSLRHHMNVNMPYFNKLYLSAAQEFDPLKTIDMSTVMSSSAEQSASTNGESENTTNANAGSRTVNSETPQTQLAGNADYATSGVDANSTTTSDGSATETGESESSSSASSSNEVSGYQGNPAELLNSYRAGLMNVDRIVLDSLQPMFMLVASIPDQYSNRSTYAYYTSPLG